MRRQGSQVSMRVARGSASWLSSHGRGLPLGLVLRQVNSTLASVAPRQRWGLSGSCPAETASDAAVRHVGPSPHNQGSNLCRLHWKAAPQLLAFSPGKEQAAECGRRASYTSLTIVAKVWWGIITCFFDFTAGARAPGGPAAETVNYK